MILDVIIFGDDEEEDVKWREIILQNVLPFSDKAFTMLVLINSLSLSNIRSIPGKVFIFSGTAVCVSLPA